MKEEEVYLKECHYCDGFTIDIEQHSTIDGEIIIIECLDCGFKVEKPFPLGVDDGFKQLVDFWNSLNKNEE